MKVLYYSDNTPTTFIHNQVRQALSNFEITYCSLNFQKKEWANDYFFQKLDYFENGWVAKIRSFLEIHDWYMDFRNRSFKKSFMKALTHFQADIIHCQFGYDALKVFDNAYSPDSKYVIHFRGYDASNKLASRQYCEKLGKVLSRENVWGVFVCKHLMQNVLDRGIQFRNEPFIIHSNTNSDFFRRKNQAPSGKFTFIQISSFRKKKGHEFTMKAFAAFLKAQKDPTQFSLVFTGFDETDHRCQEAVTLSKELNIIDQIRFLPWVTDAEARELLEHSHVAVQHSITTWDLDQEGIPNFLMEAMAMELPVISTRHAGIPELIDPTQPGGILVQEKDVSAMADAMKKHHQEWRLYPENRKVIEKDFSSELFFERLSSCYYQINSES